MRTEIGNLSFGIRRIVNFQFHRYGFDSSAVTLFQSGFRAFEVALTLGENTTPVPLIPDPLIEPIRQLAQPADLYEISCPRLRCRNNLVEAGETSSLKYRLSLRGPSYLKARSLFASAFLATSEADFNDPADVDLDFSFCGCLERCLCSTHFPPSFRRPVELR